MGRAYLVIVGMCIFLSGCNQLPTGAQDLLKKFETEGRNIWFTLTGKELATPEASPSPIPSATPTEVSAAQNSKVNAELFQEMVRVVYLREPDDRGQFGNWVDTLNQGASLEGVHNGLVRSSEYRDLESNNKAASVEALKVFASELAILEVELPSPTRFDTLTAAPLPPLEKPSGPSPDSIDSVRASPTPTVDQTAQIKKLTDLYMKTFVGNSIFTLKRVLTEEAIKVMDTKNEFKEKLALWYSKWVVRIAERNVDFGISLRNKPDEAFHYKWAIGNQEDRMKWEVLNRLHRVLNEANRQKQ